MKKLLFILTLLAFTLAGYSQANPGKTVRVAARTTVFTPNLPIGTTIFCVADSTMWITKGAAVGTLTITTALAANNILTAVTMGGATKAAEMFEAANDSLSVTGSGYYTLTLADIPKDTTSFTVSVNGVELRHTATGQYKARMTAAGPVPFKGVQINIPIYKYDVISVDYTK